MKCVKCAGTWEGNKALSTCPFCGAAVRVNMEGILRDINGIDFKQGGKRIFVSLNGDMDKVLNPMLKKAQAVKADIKQEVKLQTKAQPQEEAKAIAKNSVLFDGRELFKTNGLRLLGQIADAYEKGDKAVKNTEVAMHLYALAGFGGDRGAAEKYKKYKAQTQPQVTVQVQGPAKVEIPVKAVTPVKVETPVQTSMPAKAESQEKTAAKQPYVLRSMGNNEVLFGRNLGAGLRRGNMPWKILDRKGDKLLLYPLGPVFSGPYKEAVMKPGVRSKLADFYEDTFSEEEKELICDESGRGKMFLLDEQEYNKYFPTPKEKEFRQYGPCWSEKIAGTITPRCWIYSSDNRDTKSFVSDTGTFGSMFGSNVGMIRPAVWIKAANMTHLLGDTIVFGNSGGKDIEWEVRDWNDEAYLLLAKGPLFAGTYKDTVMRSDGNNKLNSFYRDAFTAEQKNGILDGENGKLFVLSKEEYDKCFDTAERRGFSISKSWLGDTPKNTTGWCWLRSEPGINLKQTVSNAGAYGSMYGENSGMIRPAMWVRKEAIQKNKDASSTTALSSSAPKVNTAASKVKIGDLYTFGKYKDKSIRWKVLDEREDAMLLLAEGPLFRGVFLDAIMGQGTKRKLDFFYDQAFTNAQKDKILMTAKRGKLFVLDKDEYNKYFNTAQKRSFDPTISWLEEPPKKTINVWSWLSSGPSTIQRHVVYDQGAYGAMYGSAQDGMIRPAMWVKKPL